MQTAATHTVVLCGAEGTVAVLGVTFDTGPETGSARIDPRKCSAKHLQVLYDNWVWEAENGEGDIAETITLVQ